MSESFKEEADRKINSLAAKQDAFGSLGPGDKAHLLEELLDAMKLVQADLPALSNACVLNEGYASADAEDATNAWCLEQIITVSGFTGFCKRFKGTLEAAARDGACPPPASVRTLADGRQVADVFPLDGGDKMKPNKACKCEIWMKKGKDARQGEMLKRKPAADSVGLVLGAGNLMALGIQDCLHLLFQYNTVVLYKLHAVRTYQEFFVRKLFAPLISKGYFEIIQEQSGVPDAQYLVSHPKMSHVHMTGSTETHDAIVWGPQSNRDALRKANTPVMDLAKVRVTSELGCITPYFVCPGNWTDAEVQFHALHLAVSSTANNGYFCNSPKMLILAEGWKQRAAFLDALRGVLSSMTTRPPYYPGSQKRYKSFEDAYPDMEKIKSPSSGKSEKFGEDIPWTLVNVTVDPSNLESLRKEWAFQNEPFCPVITVCTLKGVSEATPYLETATEIANKYLWGTLSCSLIIHPDTQKADVAAYDKAIASLEYGAVVINSWSAHAYMYECGLWGGYAGGDPPKESIKNTQSGLGFVNNCLAFDEPEKCVVTCPFMDTNVQIGTGAAITREGSSNLTNFMINPGLGSLLRMIFPSIFRFPCFGSRAK